ncbi:MAG: hypothetical protein ACRD1T_06540, partial [Acidimicrobiia bacterium]
FGLIRMDVLRQTHLMPGCIGGDHVLLSELSLYGRFHEIPEVLFLERHHPDRCSQQATLKDRAAWWHPEAGGTRFHSLQRLSAYPKRGRAYLAAIRRAPLNPVEKMSCLSDLPRWVGFHVRNKARRHLIKVA